jgi:hypothetical protein
MEHWIPFGTYCMFNVLMHAPATISLLTIRHCRCAVSTMCALRLSTYVICDHSLGFETKDPAR